MIGATARTIIAYCGGGGGGISWEKYDDYACTFKWGGQEGYDFDKWYEKGDFHWCKDKCERNKNCKAFRL